jgi:hypothetical protein
MLSPDELGEVARRMIETADEQEAKRLRQDFLRGFYGSQPLDAESSSSQNSSSFDGSHWSVI